MFKAVDLKPAIGSEVEIDAEALIAGTHADELRDLLVKRGVLVMRGASLDDAQLRAFADTMGTVRPGSDYEGNDEGMLKVKEIPGSYFWHSDLTYAEVPPFASILSPRVIPPEGGETEFASTYAAFQDLPPEEQDHLCTLEVVHSMKTAMDNTNFDATIEEIEAWMKVKRTQPMVWQHRSGGRSLFISVAAQHVIGLSPFESRTLLDRLMAHATQDKYVYSHKWQLGDVVMWDNTGTLHRLRPFDNSHPRLLHRFTLEGTEAVAAVPQLSNA